MPVIMEQEKKPEFMTLNEIAVLFRRSYAWVKKHHIYWEKEWGLKPVLLNGNPRLRLYRRRDIHLLTQKWGQLTPESAG